MHYITYITLYIYGIFCIVYSTLKGLCNKLVIKTKSLVIYYDGISWWITLSYRIYVEFDNI